LRIADAADALKATLATLTIPRCPVYGSHTGGAIATELARRFPSRVSALIIDGVNIFDAQETKLLLSDDYRPRIEVRDDGSHLLADWVKSRDTLTWFPWYRRDANNRLPWPFQPPQALHDYFLDRLRSGNGYQALYGAVFKHDFREAVRNLTVPATFMAHGHDILFPHLDRLPKLKPSQRIDRCPSHNSDYVGELTRVVRSCRSSGIAPPDVAFMPTPGAINRRYIDLPGGQVLVRSAGESRRGRPLLLLHDGRASSRAFEPPMRALASRRAVFAPDMPDNGASDSLAARRPQIANYADVVAEVVTQLRLDAFDIYAIGAGGAVALELLDRPAFSKVQALLEAPDFYAAPFARKLAAQWVPSLSAEWDGGHLNRLWLMLRDEFAFWPWFDKSPGAACAVDAPKDWREMHGRVVDVLRSLGTYHRLSEAALRFEWVAPLKRVRKRVRLVSAANDPRRTHVEAAARLGRVPRMAVLPKDDAGRRRELLRLLRA